MVFPFVDRYLNTGPKNNVIVTVTKFVEQVSCVSNCMLVNLFWPVHVANYHRSWHWVFTNNGTCYGGGTQAVVFSRSFTHLFRLTTTAFEGFNFPQDAKDTIFLMTFWLRLFNMVHLAFRERVKLPQNLPQREGMLPRYLLQRQGRLPSSTTCSQREKWVTQQCN